MLAPLPKTSDKFWQYSEKQSIDVADIKNILCTTHEFDLYRDKRELSCIKCHLTGRFTPTTLDIDSENKIIKIKGIEHKLNNIF